MTTTAITTYSATPPTRIMALMGEVTTRMTQNAILNLFLRMEIAEEEIEKAQQRHPQQADALWQGFKVLGPTPTVTEMEVRLYRSHCAELLDRIATGEDTRPATRAEMLQAISSMSLITPLKAEVQTLALSLFKEIYPDDFRRVLDIREEELEIYQGMQAAMIAEHRRLLARKLFQSTREFDPQAQFPPPPPDDKGDLLSLPLFQEVT